MTLINATIWPSDTTTVKCQYIRYSPKRITTEVREHMQDIWNGLYFDDDNFYAHEWSAHGACWNPILGEQSKMDPRLAEVHRTGNLIYLLP